LSSDDAVVYVIPDIARLRAQYGGGRTTAVIGTGHSAITTINELRLLAKEETETSSSKAAVNLLWATRRATDLYEDIDDDPLPQRVQLNALGNALCGDDGATVNEGFSVRHLGGVQLVEMKRNSGGKIELTFESSSSCSTDETQLTTVAVDNVVANVGFRPDLEMTRELQVHRCYATEGPMTLAAALMAASGSGGGDCLTQASAGKESLLCPEKNFLILGMKSYGRSSKFLLRVGNEQIAHAMELLDGGKPYTVAEEEEEEEEEGGGGGGK